jgi:putative ABC transport system permease protein
MVKLGGLEQTKEKYRDRLGFPRLATFVQDLRYGLRILRGNPGFSGMAILTLALGIGATTSIFGIVDAVLLQPLPYRHTDRLLALWENNLRTSDPRYPLAPANLVDLSRQSNSFEGVSAYLSFPTEFLLSSAETADRIRGAVVAPELFLLLGVNATMGRTFSPGEDEPARSAVVLISDGFWQRRLGRDPNAVGRQLNLDGRAYSVVGVLPRPFRFPTAECEVWLPLTYAGTYFPQNQITTRSVHYLGAIGRLKDGVAVEQARTELEGIARRLAAAYPESNAGIGITARPLMDEVVGNYRLALLVLFGGVAFVLMIACANVANLILVRSGARRREIAVRLAVGAGPGRIVRQLLTESTLVAILGGALGLILARWGTALLITYGPGNIPRIDLAGINGRVLMFATLLTLGTGIIFGLAPARQLAAVGLSAALKESGRSETEGPSHLRFRSLLVVMELVLSSVLVSGAGLMARSFALLTSVNPGFDSSNLLTLQIMLPPAYTSAQKKKVFYQRLFESLESIPGINYVGNATRLPLAANRAATNVTSTLTIEGQSVPREQRPEVDFRRASRDYFRAMGIPHLQGRGFNDRDTPEAPPVAIINEAASRFFDSGTSVLGKRIQLGPNPDSTRYTVVGVVGNTHHMGLDTNPRPEVYIHTLQAPPVEPFIVIRTSEDPSIIIPRVRSEIQKLDSGVPVFNIATMQELLDESLKQRRFNTLLMAGFSGLALILACIGIYGVVSCSVSQRTHEIGVRVALGAQAGDVMRLVLGQGVRLTLAGVALGLAGALTLSRWISSLLFGIQPTDPATFAVITALIVLVSLLACYLPARRALRVDPMTALRNE